jgi:hypothetical protein
VHQPVVLFDQVGGDAFLLRDLSNQVQKVGVVVKKDR